MSRKSSERTVRGRTRRPSVTFEIGLYGDVAGRVLRAAPQARVISAPTCTVLWHYIDSVEELDRFLDALMEFGITPQQLYESTGGPSRSPRSTSHHGWRRPADVVVDSADTGRPGDGQGQRTYCEVRVEGRLGDAVLHSLNWSSRVVRTTIVRIRIPYRKLKDTLTELSAVSQIDYLLTI